MYSTRLPAPNRCPLKRETLIPILTTTVSYPISGRSDRFSLRDVKQFVDISISFATGIPLHGCALLTLLLGSKYDSILTDTHRKYNARTLLDSLRDRQGRRTLPVHRGSKTLFSSIGSEMK
jgi:hypothetical protein